MRGPIVRTELSSQNTSDKVQKNIMTIDGGKKYINEYKYNFTNLSLKIYCSAYVYHLKFRFLIMWY